MARRPRNVRILMNMLVREMGIFVSHLATYNGERKPLAHSLDLMFLTIAEELDRQGISRKVAADMFEMVLRSYQRKIKRLEVRINDHDAFTIWKELYEKIYEEEEAEREQLLATYKGDRVAIVKSALKELVEAGLLDSKTRGGATYYTPSEGMIEHESAYQDRLYWLVWVSVCRGQILAYEELVEQMEPLGFSTGELDAILEQLCAHGRIERQLPDGPDGQVFYISSVCVIAPEQSFGWEAGLFDHIRTVLSSITRKMKWMRDGVKAPGVLGGSTYGFDLWEGHPYEEQILALLAKHRGEFSALRGEIDRFNADQPALSEELMYRVIFYFGQGFDDRAERVLLRRYGESSEHE